IPAIIRRRKSSETVCVWRRDALTIKSLRLSKVLILSILFWPCSGTPSEALEEMRLHASCLNGWFKPHGTGSLARSELRVSHLVSTLHSDLLLVSGSKNGGLRRFRR